MAKPAHQLSVIYNAYQRFMGQAITHPFAAVSAMLVMLLIIGTGGYMIIEGWDALDAFFMTIITMTTIGFGEVRPLSQAGRIFTIGLIVTGVITATYAVTTIVEVFSSNEILIQLRNRRQRKALDQISDHCVICGFGRMGRSLARELQARGKAVVAVDPLDDAIEQCRLLGVSAIQGSAANEDILRQAGIERATSLVVATGSDAENVFIILTARHIQPFLQIISRCHAEDSISKLEAAGADTVISPYSIAGRRIAHVLTHPTVTNFLDGVLDFGDHKMRLGEFIVGEHSQLAGLTLGEAKLNVTVLAVNHPDQQVFAHPNADTKLLAGAAVIVMGLDRELDQLEQQFKY